MITEADYCPQTGSAPRRKLSEVFAEIGALFTPGELDRAAEMVRRNREEEEPTVAQGVWTATPPDKPGWYWWRNGEGEWPFVMLVHFRNDKLWLSGYGVHTAFDKPSLDLMGGEWWSEPFQEPASE